MSRCCDVRSNSPCHAHRGDRRPEQPDVGCPLDDRRGPRLPASPTREAFEGGRSFDEAAAAVVAAFGDEVPNPATWKWQRCYRQALTGATCALAAAGCGLQQMQQLAVGNVVADGAHTLRPRHIVTMPSTAVRSAT